jgi:hypothetical protein
VFPARSALAIFATSSPEAGSEPGASRNWTDGPTQEKIQSDQIPKSRELRPAMHPNGRVRWERPTAGNTRSWCPDMAGLPAERLPKAAPPCCPRKNCSNAPGWVRPVPDPPPRAAEMASEPNMGATARAAMAMTCGLCAWFPGLGCRPVSMSLSCKPIKIFERNVRCACLSLSEVLKHVWAEGVPAPDMFWIKSIAWMLPFCIHAVESSNAGKSARVPAQDAHKVIPGSEGLAASPLRSPGMRPGTEAGLLLCLIELGHIPAAKLATSRVRKHVY